ncbi:MAG TPA: hypothetical protein VFQ44_15300 [Streptosporangiaceae bacterium]|nr:hypothetical protein [Streptosporangiaceae bacterium]
MARFTALASGPLGVPAAPAMLGATGGRGAHRALGHHQASRFHRGELIISKRGSSSS